MAYTDLGPPPPVMLSTNSPAPEESTDQLEATRNGSVLAKLARSALGGTVTHDEAPPESRRRRRDDREKEQDQQLVVSDDLYDYPKLELGSWKTPLRGQLRRRSVETELSELSRAQVQELDELLFSSRIVAKDLDAFPSSTSGLSKESSSFDYRYEAAGRVDVPNDGKVYSVPLFKREGEMTMTLVVVPRESKQAVRVASMRNPLKAPVLAGPADVYLDDEFLVTSQIETVPEGGRIAIGLGVEEGLRIARNTDYDESTQGLLGGSLSLDHAVNIEVASNLDSPARIEVRERLPVVEEDEKDVSIEVVEVTPGWENYHQSTESELRGGKRWRFALEPGQTQKLHYAFAIRIDSRHELVGGNRRERE